jgi:hypothetical protein
VVDFHNFNEYWWFCVIMTEMWCFLKFSHMVQELILRPVIAQESRTLTDAEFLLRKQLKMRVWP